MRLLLRTLVLTLIGITLTSVNVFSQSATIATDQADYAPGSTAIITGSGFTPGETVTLQVLHDPTGADDATSLAHQPWTVIADANGNVSSSWDVPLNEDELGATLKLTALGQSSGLTASAIFTDADAITIAGSFCSGSLTTNFTASVPSNGNNIKCLRLEFPSGFSVASVSTGNLPSGYSATGTGTASINISGSTNLNTSTMYSFSVTFSAVPSGSYNVSSKSASSCPTNTNGGNTATVTVNPNTAITTDVSSPDPVCAGATAPQLNVTATGTGTLHYHWYSNSTANNTGGSAVGSDVSTYTPDVSAAGTYYYYVIVSSDCGSKTSAVATVVVNPNTAITTDVSSPDPVCPGTTAPQLSVIATGTGTLHYQWYSNSTDNNTGGSTIGSDASTYTPDVSTAGTYYYYVVVSSDCGSKTSAVATVTVKTLSTAPTSAISDVNNFCADAGGNIQLTASGGTLGSGALVKWYSGSCGGTLAGTGNPLTIAKPTSTTTYYARYEGDCNTTTCASVTVTVKTESTAPTGATTSADNFCPGGNTDLAVTGGSLGTGANWHWYTGSCGGTEVGTGATLNVSPTVTTTYYVRAEGDCNTTTCASVTVNIASNPPTIISVIPSTNDPVQIKTSMSLSISYSDLDNNVTNATIDWGDGTIDNPTTSNSPLTVSHTYNSTGVYTVNITITDACSSNSATYPYQYAVIYDPSGGFITGGGWINSPTGAYNADPTLTGKASFGFNAQYKKGNNTPDGNTQFQFQAGNLNFHSSSYSLGSLVIAGAKAIYQGTGTINGTGTYNFLVSAIDGNLLGTGKPDMFRIKIWNTGGVIYDNNVQGSTDYNADPVTALGGGSIVIHNPNGKNSRVMNSTITGSAVEVNSNQISNETGTGTLTVKVIPNPTSYFFTAGLQSLSKENVNMVVTDITGRVIEQRTNIAANSTIQFGSHYRPGTYIAQFLQGIDKVTVKLIKESD